jgi:hypothetical protein
VKRRAGVAGVEDMTMHTLWMEFHSLEMARAALRFPAARTRARSKVLPPPKSHRGAAWQRSCAHVPVCSVLCPPSHAC